MAMANRVSNDQLEELLDFLAEHPALAKGVGLGARSKEIVDKQWDNLATKLNSYGSGSSKSGERWKRYWADIKHKTKTRLAKRRRDPLGTDDGPSSQDDLSETDRKILSIIGEQAIHGDSEHRIPFLSKEFPEQKISPEILITDNIAENVPVTVVSPSTRGQTCRLSSPTANDADILRRKNILIEREQQKQLYLYRRSILHIEKDIALEKLRHMKEINRVKELMEVENLDHQRAMNQIVLRRASGALN